MEDSPTFRIYAFQGEQVVHEPFEWVNDTLEAGSQYGNGL